MPDPLSITASVIAILTFAIQSCRYLSDCLSQVSHAPVEVKNHQVFLQDLAVTLIELRSICNDITVIGKIQVSINFENRLLSCRDDLQEMRLFVQSTRQRMEGGKLLKNWSRVKYALFSEPRFKRFAKRLQQHRIALSTDMLLLQTKLSICNSVQLDQLVTNSQELKKGQTLLYITTRKQYAPVHNMALREGNKGFRTRSWYTYSLGCCSAVISVGDSRQKNLIPNISQKKPSTLSRTRAGLRILVQTHWSARPKVITMSLDLDRSDLSRCAYLRFGLSHSYILPQHAEIFKHVRHGQLHIIRSMFELGKATPFDTTANGISLLHIASGHDQTGIVNFLLDSGAHVDAADSNGRTPLHWAIASSKDFEICRTLIKNGADVCSPDMEGKTPLHTFFNPIISTILLYHKDEIDEMLFDKDGMTIVQYAGWTSKSETTHLSAYLKEQPYLTLSSDIKGRNLLHFACERGNTSLLEYLLQSQPALDIARPDSEGCMPIHYAARSRRVAAIDLLMQVGADIKAKSAQGWTVLHEAAARDNVAAIEHVIMLLGASAISMLNEKDLYGLTAFNIAKRRRAVLVMDYLERTFGARVTGEPKDSVPESPSQVLQKERFLGRPALVTYTAYVTYLIVAFFMGLLSLLFQY